VEIIRSEKCGVNCFAIEGRLDAVTVTELEETLFPFLDTNKANVLINLDDLDYISSAGLRVFLLAVKKVKAQDGKIVFCSLSENVKEVFEITGLLSIFNIFDDNKAAINSFTSA
jgi:anti-anti-sigma factor